MSLFVGSIPTAAITTDSGRSDILPTYEDIRKAHQPIGPTRDAQRLQWTLEGPLSSAIRVMEDTYYTSQTPSAPYFDKATATWSPVSQSALTEPKISSVNVCVEQLQEWETQWLEFHFDHTEAGDHNEGNDEVRYGMLPDFDPETDEDEESHEHLLRCCGGERPRGKAVSLLVKATGEFLTIHDYVSAVHPWLMSLREDLLQAAGDLLDNIPLPSDAKLMVNFLGNHVWVIEEWEWRKMNGKEGHLRLAKVLDYKSKSNENFYC
ncbi:uncharacterized protein K460DRAFT_409737 [Cucurbitaria berberidis CBS 394.84]|uniref:Uncharacterized protein n=1 Tax=Cucurbitaria berberidis CBS 394.84 TaxID=1168544 RepID=A0A9P4GBD2_9PLEO|nr:uncharacterized protein K460DRAFT_409737 [Cucurbitaria berberidis CBS 394.84]KAF1842322.1 hypothetical protein K460DRAFT_409737 [Cucurbitaria berberidis CBS 394.84]